MAIDWNAVIGGALGGITFAVCAGLGTFAWVKVSALIRKRPLFRFERKSGDRYILTKLRSGPVQNLTFTTSAKGVTTSPNGQLEPASPLMGPIRKGDALTLYIEPGRAVDAIHLQWEERANRMASGELDGDTVDIFPSKKPRRRLGEIFK